MQISLFCDYRGYINSKYESLFLALEESFASVAKKKGPGRIGYGDLVYLKVLENAREDQPRVAFVCVQRDFKLGVRGGQALFTDHMLALVEGVSDDLSVAGVVGTDAHAVDFRIVQDVAIIGA